MLDKNLTPGAFEGRLYDAWERSGAFAAAPTSNAVPYAIVLPPPNVTGSLHIGHALDHTIQDTLIRWRRMQGRDALWQPGTDHAGIATQMVVERLLAGEGKDRRAMGREAFLDRVWAWKEESGGTITRQMRRLGTSCDWSRERFTMDEGLSEAVCEVFVTLHGQGLIYRDRRLVNWDPKFQTAISDLEVESREVKGSLWYLRYPVEGEPGRHLVVATTRPETMLGDTAVAVHPDDERHRDLIGKHVILPIVGRRIPVVADSYSDPEKGSGAVKITPAHDFNDFEVGKRHGLPSPAVLDEYGRVTLAEIEADAAPDGLPFLRTLAGIDRADARKAVLAELERLDLIEKIEPHTHAVPHGDRSGVPIEPRLTWQWYADAKTLAAPAIKAVEEGRTKFVPQQWENTFFAWMRDIQPWCISRQLWWGHQIPAWYGPDNRIFVARTEEDARAAARAHYGDDRALTRDPDVLDTWFSSALWPFSTLGWPKQTPELNRYYPGDVLVTGFDIIFFWVARMMMMGIHFMGDVPFRVVNIHGLVRDEKGQKMSKSKGNVMDPLELADAYGADALRFTLASVAGPGRDARLGRKTVENTRSFVTKLWNAARFCEMNGIGPAPDFEPATARAPLARWLLDAANSAVTACDAALEAYRLDEYSAALYRFTYGTYCDWFLELAKPTLYGDDGPEKDEIKAVAGHVLGMLLRLAHPAMPFVTEELWDRFGYGPEGSLIRAPWPETGEVDDPASARTDIDRVVSLISEIRSVRAEMNVPAAAHVDLIVPITPGLQVRLPSGEPGSSEVHQWADQLVSRYAERIMRMARVNLPVTHQFLSREEATEFARGKMQLVVSDYVFFLDLKGKIDLPAERARLTKEHAKADAEARKIATKLANPDFTSRAKEEVVEETRERLAAAEAEAGRLAAALARIAA